MLTIYSIKNRLVAEYLPDGPASWLVDLLKKDDEIPLAKVFYFWPKDLISPNVSSLISEEPVDDDGFRFGLGDLEGEYFVVPGRKLGISQTVRFHQSIDVTTKYFRAVRGVSVFKSLARLTKEDIFVGGSAPTAIPKEDFLALLQKFPSQYELQRYVEARLSVILRNYIDQSKDAVSTYLAYMNKRETATGDALLPRFRDSEVEKYRAIETKLQQMLANEDGYSEGQWQAEILEIILLLYPRYIAAVPEGPVIDTITGKHRRVDFVLADYSGHVDVVEIKKPFDRAIVTGGTYRDNHIPLRELTGTVMQIEKYLFHLSRSGKRGERNLKDHFGKRIPADLPIHITNPIGLVVIGRDVNLDEEQRLDFEVIRRHYKNIVDIVSYDDLLRRLQSTVRAFEDGKTLP